MKLPEFHRLEKQNIIEAIYETAWQVEKKFHVFFNEKALKRANSGQHKSKSWGYFLDTYVIQQR